VAAEGRDEQHEELLEAVVERVSEGGLADRVCLDLIQMLKVGLG
jgi:3-dehydroquinate synthase class II